MRRLSVGFTVLLFLWGCAGEPTHSGFTENDGGAGGPDATSTSVGGNNPGPLPTCVHNDDCNAPDLCVGNNGRQCTGGVCVPTSKPMSCDDGIACTNDACDA